MEIRNALENELELFQSFEAGEDTKEYIIPYTMEKHIEEFNKAGIVYKTILNGSKIIGFMILNLEEDGKSVEFRRIVINEKGKGFGMMAIKYLDYIVKEEYIRNRIWLDVYANNERGIHIYEKCGYKYLKSVEYQGKELKVYEKIL
jgi:ribosomal protein S18 acetylase RimI-like enzyme